MLAEAGLLDTAEKLLLLLVTGQTEDGAGAFGLIRPQGPILDIRIILDL